MATGIAKKVLYKKETDFGVITTPDNGKSLRRVSSDLNLTKETYESQEIRTDYQTSDFRHGVRSVEGTINVELSSASYSDFLGSVLSKDFSTITISSLGSVTISAGVAPSTYVITRSTGDYLADELRTGMVVRLSGFNTANNGVNLIVLALTATEATVATLNGQAIVLETVATGAAMALAGKVTYAPETAHTDDSYTIEHIFEDVNRSEVFTGCKINTASFALPATGLVTADFGIMGQNLALRQNQQYFQNPAPQGTNGIFAAVQGFLAIDGDALARVTGLNININRNMTAEAVVGSDIKPDINIGRVGVDGDFSTLFDDQSNFSEYFDNESELSLICALTASKAPDADFVVFTLPRIKLSTDTKDDGEKQIVAQNSFKALKGFGTDGFEATTLMIQDSAA